MKLKLKHNISDTSTDLNNNVSSIIQSKIGGKINHKEKFNKETPYSRSLDVSVDRQI